MNAKAKPLFSVENCDKVQFKEGIDLNIYDKSGKLLQERNHLKVLDSNGMIIMIIQNIGEFFAKRGFTYRVSNPNRTVFLRYMKIR